jgi:hypothetical protein
MSRHRHSGVVPTALAAEFLVVLFASPIALADSVCEKGDRDTTAAERSAMTTTLESVRAALPQAPDGWVIGGYEELSAPPATRCADSDGIPWGYGFSRHYNRADDVAEREQAQAEAQAAIQADMAAKQPRIDALIAKGQELFVAIGEAVQAGDQARVDALDREYQALQAEIESAYTDSSTQSQYDALGAAISQDRTMSIAVEINATAGYIEGMQASEAPAGASHAFRGQTTEGGVTEGRTLVMFGDWEERESNILGSKKRDVSDAAAHAILVTVTADPARLDTLLAAIDFDAIAALVE